MRFSSIEITNYRQYRHMRLEFPRGEYDLQVLVGDNGTGKTNLLNAFTWCLYGKEPHLGTEDAKKGEPKLNKEVLAEAYDDHVVTKNVQVAIEIEDGDDVVRIERMLPCRVQSETTVMEMNIRETFRFTRLSPDGHTKVYADDDAAIRVNQILPETIREYFFFDGEQLTSYFSDMRGDAIKAAIYSISQIDVITKMKNNLSNVVKELTRNAKNSAPDLESFTDKVENREKQYDRASAAVDKCESEAVRLKQEIGDLDEKLRGIPDIAKLEAKRVKLRAEIETASQTEQEAKDDLTRFARDSFVMFAFYDVARKTLDVISEMERNNQLPPSIDSSYLQEMIHERVCKVCKRSLSEQEVAQLEQLLEQQRVSSETSNILSSMRSELRRIVEYVESYPKKKERVLRSFNRAKDTRKGLESDFVLNDEQLRSTPNSAEVKQWQRERDEYTQLLSETDMKKGENLRIKKSAANMLKKEMKERDDAIRQNAQLKELSESIAFGSEAVSILEKAEKDIISSVRHEMEERTEELFKGLVWKDSKCDRIELNKNFNLSLYDLAGFSCAGTCSAAERSLLALSFTLAMHQVSGFESPLYIDTPIARASGQNRANFAETLAEVSKDKQIILTFTPDEYSEAIASVFDPIAASRLEMKMDENRGVSTIKGGC